MSNEIKIDKDVPLPITRKANNNIYPWDKMEVGDSFLIENPLKGRGIVSYINKVKAPKRFCTRRVDGGVRVWRFE